MSSSKARIGFVGLGVMGTPMAGHLAKGGYEVAVFDLAAAARDAAVAAGGGRISAFDTPREVARRADIVITMLPNGRVVREVALGKDGLAEGFAAGALLLDTSSSEPWITRETAQALAARGVGMLDAPVSGAQWGAQAAELVFMVGGAKSDFERVAPLLALMGRKSFHLGPLGAGHAMKCLNNTITAMTFAATIEGLALGKHHGLDPAVMNEVLNESTGGSWITRNHIEQRILSRSFDDPFKLDLMAKDVGIALELARQADMPVPMSAAGQQIYRAAALDAGAGASLSELARWIEKTMHTEVSPGSNADAG